MAHLPNVHMFHYQTMSNDLHGQMQRVASAIGVSHPPKLFDRLVSKATFESMKADAHLTAPGAKGGLYYDPSAFFNSGRGRKWVGKLNEVQIADYNAKIASELSADDVRYIETGLE